MRTVTNLAIDVFQKLIGDDMDLFVDGSDDELDGTLHGLNAGLQRTRLLLGQAIQV